MPLAVPVTIIRNAQNVGFPRAINQGLQAARGEYLVLLNNDAVVTDGWLDQLIALTAARVGIWRSGDLRSGRRRGRETRAQRGDLRSAGRRGRETRRPTRRRTAGSGDPRRRPDAPPPLSGSAWSGRCPITPRRRNSSRTCRTGTWTRCTPSPGGGATSIAASGSRCPSSRAFAC